MKTEAITKIEKHLNSHLGCYKDGDNDKFLAFPKSDKIMFGTTRVTLLSPPVDNVDDLNELKDKLLRHIEKYTSFNDDEIRRRAKECLSIAKEELRKLYTKLNYTIPSDLGKTVDWDRIDSDEEEEKLEIMKEARKVELQAEERNEEQPTDEEDGETDLFLTPASPQPIPEHVPNSPWNTVLRRECTRLNAGYNMDEAMKEARQVQQDVFDNWEPPKTPTTTLWMRHIDADGPRNDNGPINDEPRNEDGPINDDPRNEDGPRNDMNERQEQVIGLMWEEPNITFDKISEILNVSRNTVKRDIKKLQSLGIVMREGSNKGGKWIVNIIDRKPSNIKPTSVSNNSVKEDEYIPIDEIE